MEAIVLAGGLGSRLKPVVSDVPKPMAPINDRPFLEYLLDYWIGQGIRRFILSVGYKHDIIKDHFGARYQIADIAYAVEESPRGTGGGLLLAIERLCESDTFMIVNGDTFFEVPLAPMQQQHQDYKAAVTIALREVESNNRYASVEIDKTGKITAFDNRARTSTRALINGGVYLAEKSAFTAMALKPEESVSLENELYPRMLAAGQKMYGFASRGRFIDIGIPDDYQRAAFLLANA